MAGGNRMSKLQSIFTTCALLVGLAAPAAAQTPAVPSAKVGILTCSVSPGVGFIVGGRQNLACRFQSSSPRYAPESYLGDITTIGLDIGVSGGGTLTWAVFMPTEGAQYGALAGEYVGASAQATLGVGIGANVLVGGSNRSVTLQPFSIEGDVGVNLAVGVSSMVLRAER
jgi:hypothetical protein